MIYRVAASTAGRNAIQQVKQETEREKNLESAEARIRDKEAVLDRKLADVGALKAELDEQIANSKKMDGVVERIRKVRDTGKRYSSATSLMLC